MTARIKSGFLCPNCGSDQFYARWNQIACRPNTRTRMYYCKQCQKTYTNNQIRGIKQ
jgi:DNA-directed RNA polymerase subunit M/transcription elongation factor TFIIS